MADFELQILREVAGQLPMSAWGAAVGQALETLEGSGFIDYFHNLTDKGHAFLWSLEKSPST